MFSFGVTNNTFRAGANPAPPLIGELGAAKEEGQYWERRHDIVKSCYHRQRLDYLNDTAKFNMEVEHYEETIAGLHEELRISRNKESQLRSQNSQLESSINGREADINSKDSQIAAHTSQIAALQSQLKDAKGDANDKKSAISNLESLLSKAHADTDQTRNELRTARDERDKAAAKHYETELKLVSLHTEWEEMQDKLEELDRAKEAAAELDAQCTELESDLQNVQKQVEDKEHYLSVKDERIGYLEKQVQKALQDALRTVANAEAAHSPTAAPVVVAGDSLQSELDELADEEFESDRESAFDQVLELSNITAVGTAPVTPKLKLSNVRSTQTEPTATAVHSTQTELNLSSVQATQTEPTIPTMGTSAIATVIDQAPAKPEYTAAAIQTDVVERSDPPVQAEPGMRDMSTIKAVETSPMSPVESGSRIMMVDKSRKVSALMQALPFVTAALALLCAWLWTRLSAWEYANGVYHRDIGDYGNGVYLFNVIPIGFHVGDSALAQFVSRGMAKFIYSMEEWAGVDRVPFH